MLERVSYNNHEFLGVSESDVEKCTAFQTLKGLEVDDSLVLEKKKLGCPLYYHAFLSPWKEAFHSLLN